MPIEPEFRKVSELFYIALNVMVNGDAGLLADIWSHSTAVTTMHPKGGREIGWEAVRESFEQVVRPSSDGKVGLKDQFIKVAGNWAYEIGVEHGQLGLAGQQVTIKQRVMNIYRRE